MIPNEFLEQVEMLIKVKIEEEFRNRGFISSSSVEEEEWLNQKSAAAYAGVCVNTFKTFETRGLKVYREGGKVLVSKSEVDRYLKKHSR